MCRLHVRRQLNVRSVCVLWTEFVEECRYHFEVGLDLPHVQAGDLPDYRSCVLHQKLQTLQRCIALQRQRQEVEKNKAEGQEADAQMPLTPRPPTSVGSSEEAATDGLADGWQDFDELKADSAMDVSEDEEEHKDAAQDEEDAGQEDSEEADAAASRPPRGVLHPLRDERLLLSATDGHLTSLEDCLHRALLYALDSSPAAFSPPFVCGRCAVWTVLCVCPSVSRV